MVRQLKNGRFCVLIIILWLWSVPCVDSAQQTACNGGGVAGGHLMQHRRKGKRLRSTLPRGYGRLAMHLSTFVRRASRRTSTSAATRFRTTTATSAQCNSRRCARRRGYPTAVFLNLTNFLPSVQSLVSFFFLCITILYAVR